ncbi:hypothetical protein [Natronoglycomyces albus]|uniref:SRPBCC family protein n=1 Tax=Natronoglycomyces albus TaxID=2811108 RepID=A0A895XKW4_9ACTN|nr:hypothetical protein [Natronoglycomyces albus]QSB06361.1 hypothetical protein JQS30_05475 [Natronoglycomyces albus]
MKNIHERVIEAPVQSVAGLLNNLGQPEDRLWPSEKWVPMVMDRPLAVGAAGGHGEIRYRVTEFEPGKRVRFAFHPKSGIDGTHEMTLVALGKRRCRLRHEFHGRPTGFMRILLPLVVIHLHNALLEDLLDNAQRAATGAVAKPATWSWWVRLWHWIVERPMVKAHQANMAFARR